MRLALLSCGFLLLSVPASAGVWSRDAVLPHCQFLNTPLPEACRSGLPPDALAAVLPVADRLVRDEQVRQIRDYDRKRMLEELDGPIESRKVMLACLDNPQTNYCSARVKALRASLEENLRRLRLAVALSHSPQNPDDRSFGSYVNLPISLGGAALTPLSAAEVEAAERFQRSALFSLERIGISRLRQELGLKISSAELERRCANADPEYFEACQRLSGIRRGSFARFRQSMGKISDSIIAQLPLTLRFHSSPITDAALRTELASSLQVLEKWRADVAKGKGSADVNRVADGTPFTDEFVSLHPEACAAAEEEIRRLGLRSLGKKVATTGATILGMSTLCAFASPAVCVTVWGGLSAHGVTKNYLTWKGTRDRLASADAENPDANLVRAHDKYRDLLVDIALSAVFTTKGVIGVAMPETATAAAGALETGSPGFFGEAGSAFEKISTNVYGSLKGTAISQVTKGGAEEIASKDQTTRYDDWLASDAFTARVFESFLNHLGNP